MDGCEGHCHLGEAGTRSVSSVGECVRVGSGGGGSSWVMVGIEVVGIKVVGG